MLLHDRPELHIQYDSEAHLLRTCWTGRTPTECLRATAGLLVALAQRHQARCYLLDLKPLNDITVYDQIWLSTHWVAQMPDLSLRRVAVLLNERHLHNQMAVESVVASGRAHFPFEVQLFSESRSALRWLTDDSARVPSLLAEWNATFPLVAVPHPRRAALNGPIAHAA